MERFSQNFMIVSEKYTFFFYKQSIFDPRPENCLGLSKKSPEQNCLYIKKGVVTLNITHHIEVKDNVKPVVTHVRKVPHTLKPKLEKELKRMVDLDIIKPIKKPTEWVNSLVIAEKPNGKLRICLNL